MKERAENWQASCTMERQRYATHESERVLAPGATEWEAERKALVSKIDILEANQRSMASIMDQAAVDIKERQALLEAARQSCRERDDERNLLRSEVASLKLEVERLNAGNLAERQAGGFSEDQLHLAIRQTIEKDKVIFDERMAEMTVQLDNEHRAKIRELEERMESWIEAVQSLKEKSEGQTIDITWWEAFGETYPEQLAEFERQGYELGSGGCEPAKGLGVAGGCPPS